MFITRTFKLDTVKRYSKQKVTLPRDNLVSWLSWFNTHDNNTDEFWYGMYGNTVLKTQAYYDTHAVYRWWCRVMWLQRNSAYGFNYAYFSKPLEDVTKSYEWGNEATAWWFHLDIRPSSFQLEVHHPLWRGKYNSINIGWKSHTDMPKMLYAGRILGIRKVT
jgi:hypothetical protein